MDKNQTGFVPELGTAVNIREVINYLKKCKKKDNIAAIFIDYSSAYNSIIREKLYKILKTKLILNEDEIKFLRVLHDHAHFEVNGKNYYFLNGVH